MNRETGSILTGRRDGRSWLRSRRESLLLLAGQGGDGFKFAVDLRLGRRFERCALLSMPGLLPVKRPVIQNVATDEGSCAVITTPPALWLATEPAWKGSRLIFNGNTAEGAPPPKPHSQGGLGAGRIPQATKNAERAASNNSCRFAAYKPREVQKPSPTRSNINHGYSQVEGR